MNASYTAYAKLDCNLNQAYIFVSDLYNNLLNNFKQYTKDALEHLILASIIYILVCIFLYCAAVKWKFIKFHRDVKSLNRVLLVIAHPDDECMFFGPVVINLTKKEDCEIYLLCLSTGRNYGMGNTRKKELYKACEVLGIKSENILIKQSTNLPDSMDAKWPIEVVAKFILEEVEAYNITTLISFDKHGISQHPNHCSIYYAIAHLSMEKLLPTDCTVYVLETVNVLRKYWSFLDLPLSFLLSRQRFVLDCPKRMQLFKAMSQHKSQLLWFRYLYLIFSKYVFINTLQEMNLSDIELDLEIDD